MDVLLVQCRVGHAALLHWLVLRQLVLRYCFTRYILFVALSLYLILGAVLSAASVVSGLSGIVAARLIAAIGAINTMVFTHLPSNILLGLVSIDRFPLRFSI